METQLSTQKLVLSFEKQQKLAIDLDNLKIKRKRVEEDSVKDFRQLQFRLTSKVRNEVINVVQNLAREKEFTLVLDTSSSSVIYFDQAFDITAEVIRIYDTSKKDTK
jgi:Skp family chaperone for outer membrane proteins